MYFKEIIQILRSCYSNFLQYSVTSFVNQTALGLINLHIDQINVKVPALQ